jgi:hypothetical protein
MLRGTQLRKFFFCAEKQLLFKKIFAGILRTYFFQIGFFKSGN